MAKYQSAWRREGLGASGNKSGHRLGNSYKGTPRSQSDYSKNSAKAYNPIQKGEWGTPGVGLRPDDAGKLYGAAEIKGCQHVSGTKGKPESDKAFHKRMERALGPDHAKG